MEQTEFVRRSISVGHRVVGAVLAVIGYILSPLSWWNDALVNVPIGLAVAYVLNSLIGLSKLLGFYIGYLLSNVAGMVLLFYGGYLAYSGRPRHRWRHIILGIVASTIYTVAASIVLYLVGVLG